MIIKNIQSLAVNTEKKYALSIIEAGLEAGLPGPKLEKIIHGSHLKLKEKKINLKQYRRVFVIAIGKAAHLMSKAVNSLTNIDGGLIVVPKGTVVNLKGKFKVIWAKHPVPDKSSVTAAKQILSFLSKTRQNDFVIFLISGGASSLVALPDGISLQEKQAVNDALLRSGADIREINCIRKHLSKIKGGKLLDYLNSDAVSLVISDVVGDDLSTIASGITYFDRTTFRDAKRILQKFNLEKSLPKNVLKRINLGIKGKIAETPKNKRIRNYLILTNKDCLRAMQRRSRELGFSTRIVSCISGDVSNVGRRLAKKFSNKSMNCIIFGGETTVTVKGTGKGGRNQELVLYTALNLDLQGKKATVLSVGTDGVDGNTNCAGAICDSNINKAKAQPFLENNDVYHFFIKYRSLIYTGPTGTNLMDIGIILQR